MNCLRKVNKSINLLKHRLWRKGLINGIAAAIELENFVKDIHFETIIDIGSNKGQFILLIEQFFPNKIIHSFEPITDILEKQKKFFNFKENIYFHNFALGSISSMKNFYITRRKDSSSFFKINENNSNFYEIENERKIQIKTLDNVLTNHEVKKPILMKIDVQGYELEVLKGSINSLKEIEFILIEVSENEMYKDQPLANEVIQFLKDKNFEILKQNTLNKIDKTNFLQKDLLLQNQQKIK